MKGIVPLRAAGAILVLALAGCDAFFTANVFSVFDGPPKVNLDESLEKDDLETLAIAVESEEFYKDLAGNPQGSKRVETFLTEMSVDPDPQTKATASQALTEYYKNTSPAGQTLQNMSTLMNELIDGAADLAIEQFMEALLPEESLTSKQTFAEYVEDFRKLDAAFASMNDALADPVASIGDPGAAMQGALIVYLVTETIDAIVVEPGEDPVDILYHALTAEDPGSSLDIELKPEFDEESILTGMTAEGSGVENIVEAAGFATLLESWETSQDQG